jgi:hypothetical protein
MQAFLELSGSACNTFIDDMYLRRLAQYIPL